MSYIVVLGLLRIDYSLSKISDFIDSFLKLLYQ
jgi:hypothetical protein